MAGKVEAICISEKKGTEKKPIQETKIIEDFGLEHDAHAGKWHRQVSLLPYEEREDFKRRGGDVDSVVSPGISAGKSYSSRNSCKSIPASSATCAIVRPLTSTYPSLLYTVCATRFSCPVRSSYW